MKLPLGRIAELIGGSGGIDAAAVAAGYSIDSRTIKPGELFFAVRGERLDGHEFVPAALQRGAVAAVVAREQAARFVNRSPLLLVNDPLNALQTLGQAGRRIWNKRLVAVTGSAGKTTTKEAIAALLGTRFRVLKSVGNLNNHFGLPLQLLRLEPEHDVAVVELGMNHAGEIAALAALAQPDMGVVTCVAPVHLGFFQSVAEIARAKYELIQNLSPTATAVLNADDEYVSQFGRDFGGKVVTFGITRPADVRAEQVEQGGTAGSVFEVISGGQRVTAELPLLGRHNVYNALAAVAVVRELGLTLAEAATGLKLLTPADKRGEILQIAGVTVINDCYNSNPKALQSMVDVVATMPTQGRRIVVAGEMLELGLTTDELHQGCGSYMAERGVDIVLGVRGAARQITAAANAGGIRVEFVDSPEQAGEWLAGEARPGDLVLLKASRGVQLERALAAWRAGLEAKVSGSGL
jgi:UDP-N-acetylmuramoyl-tripeptide--D-alanyl-D-alanine ligase